MEFEQKLTFSAHRWEWAARSRLELSLRRTRPFRSVEYEREFWSDLVPARLRRSVVGSQQPGLRAEWDVVLLALKQASPLRLVLVQPWKLFLLWQARPSPVAEARFAAVPSQCQSGPCLQS